MGSLMRQAPVKRGPVHAQKRSHVLAALVLVDQLAGVFDLLLFGAMRSQSWVAKTNDAKVADAGELDGRRWTSGASWLAGSRSISALISKLIKYIQLRRAGRARSVGCFRCRSLARNTGNDGKRGAHLFFTRLGLDDCPAVFAEKVPIAIVLLLRRAIWGRAR